MSYAPLGPGLHPGMAGAIDPVAALLAMRPEMGAVTSYSAPQAAPDPFQWGQGGAMLTQADIDRRRQMADAQTMGDYSPVEHWTQGAGRVLDGFLGGMETRKLDREQRALNTDRAASVAALLGPENADLAGAFTSGDKIAAQLAGDVFDVRNRKSAAPHYWETNNGSLGMIGSDGAPQIVYEDPTPKISWIQADNGDGTKTLIPMGPNGPVSQEGGGPASGVGGMPDWWSAFSPEEQGVIMRQAQSRAGRNIPNGSPVSPPKTLPPDFDFGDSR